MRTNLLKDTATTDHNTAVGERRTAELSCSSTKANPLVEISVNRKRRQPLDFSSAFANKKGARRVDEVDLPCTCDDCRFLFSVTFAPILFVSTLNNILQVCDSSPCWENAGQGHLLPLPPLQAC